jgi:hypothetical protein
MIRVWRMHAAEHSTKFKISGRFETLADARDAAELFNRLVELGGAAADDDELHSAVTQACREASLQELPEQDVRHLQRLGPVTAGGREIRAEMDTPEFHSLLRVHYGASIQIYNRRPCGAEGSADEAP